MGRILRFDGRKSSELRPISIERNYTKYAEGSVLISVGDTVVLCNATVEEKVPPFLRGSGRGWITAEYALLPRSTQTRVHRESIRGKPSGRTCEIQRLIGRCLRSVVDLDLLGENTIWFDCDVIQADGGTRTAAVNGAFIALVDAIKDMLDHKLIEKTPLTDYLAGISVGIVDGCLMADLVYEEDSTAQVDMNIMGTGTGKLVEIQGTAEGFPFSRQDFDVLINLGLAGIKEITALQKDVLGPLAELIPTESTDNTTDEGK